jgi:hypothetical protein
VRYSSSDILFFLCIVGGGDQRKTGGLVIWRSGTSVSLYRGVDYGVAEPTKEPKKNPQALGMRSSGSDSPNPSLLPREKVGSLQDSNGSFISNTGKEEIVEQTPEIKYEDEIDKLLDELGPRYSDWPGSDPLPVDADLLPATVSGYKPPFRVLPYGVRRSLSRKDTTNLCRLSRGLPPHFALGTLSCLFILCFYQFIFSRNLQFSPYRWILGRSRQLQGLASAMVKLWEKSSIAKIALKRGVQLTTSERMAEDIKVSTKSFSYCIIFSSNDI